ncbi:MAG: S1C family serine protease [Candidatus Pacebacteria bacterium]|nr:S1C family serine protease [Candidatus Paceibacterota bacterium]
MESTKKNKKREVPKEVAASAKVSVRKKKVVSVAKKVDKCGCRHCCVFGFLVKVVITIALLLTAFLLFMEVFSPDPKPEVKRQSLEDIQQPVIEEDDEDLETYAMFDDVYPAVVSIVAADEADEFERQHFYMTKQSHNPSTGFFISSDGYIVTTKQVIDDADEEYIVILDDDVHTHSRVAVEKIFIDPNPDKDIVILKIDMTDMPFMDLEEDCSAYYIGQTVFAMGHSAVGTTNTLSEGIVSAYGRSTSFTNPSGETEAVNDLVQLDMALSADYSGGPVVCQNGKIFGLIVAPTGGQESGYVVSAYYIKSDLDQVLSTGSIAKKDSFSIGIIYRTIDGEDQEKLGIPYNYGAAIFNSGEYAGGRVIPGSPADKAGIKEGDIILEWDGQKITTETPLSKVSENYSAGETVRVKIYRDGEEIEIMLTLGKGI